VDKHTEKVLEFSKIKSILAKYTSSPSVKELCLNLTPLSDLEKIKYLFNEIKELEDLLRYNKFSFRDFTDIRVYVHKLKMGGVLTGIELYNIGRILLDFYNIKKFFSSKEKDLIYLSVHLKNIGTFQELRRGIMNAVGEDGELKDDASQRLRSIRNNKRRLSGKIRSILDSIMKNSIYQKIVSQQLITIRNGRYVIPLKEGFSKILPGIVHDRSGSGLTYFVEPIQILDLNNDLIRLEKEEKREEETILRDFTIRINKRLEDILSSFSSMSYIHFVYIKYLFANDYNASCPALNTKGYIELIDARHPLLKKDVVPISVKLGKDYDIMVITGPNTGGKTVSLKTVGLLTLMAQAGLFIPASPDSNIGVFDKIFADIGDEQSIEQSLSTFSSHMNNIINILKQVDDKSLVLLDELGAGTDPEEGAALGMAIISYLKEKGAKAIITTHYTPLKEYAYLEDRVINASVEFDADLLKPTYRLSIGLPGKSNAFLIAKRLGLQTEILKMAQEFLSSERLRVEDFLKEIEKYRDRSYRESEKLKRLRQNLSRLKVERERLLREKEIEIERIKKEALEQAQKIILETSKKLNKIIYKIRSENASKESTRFAREFLKEEAKKIEEMKLDLNNVREIQGKDVEDIKDDTSFDIGDLVEVKNTGLKGEIENIDKSKIIVNCNGMRITTNIENLKKLEKTQQNNLDTGIILANFIEKKAKATNKLYIRKMFSEEAEPLIRKFLDDAYLLRISPVYIVHGKGMGVLKNLTHEILRETPYVKKFRPGLPEEGGGGVTVVYLDL